MDHRLENKSDDLLLHLDNLHTTAMGAERIKRNLALNTDDIIGWCRDRISDSNTVITRQGKNWYVVADNCEITVNARSYMVITAHKTKKKQQEDKEMSIAVRYVEESDRELYQPQISEEGIWQAADGVLGAGYESGGTRNGSGVHAGR